MSVHPRRVRRSSTPTVAAPEMVAADLVKADGPHKGTIKADHPLAGAFTAWLGENAPTKRQAAKFLADHPQYRAVKAA
jgi:hypothetical protein